MKKWPNWKNKLTSPNKEGGLRLNGIYKSVEDVLVSYVTVVRNNEKTIRRCIESVQEQSYKNVEHIIIDGNSTDKTLDIIKEYESVIDYFASEDDLGLYDALNKAIELTTGHLILVLNSDDWLPSDSAEYAANHYKRDTAQFIAGTAKVFVSETSDVVFWKPQRVSATSYFSVANLNHNAVYASRESYELSGPYDISYKIAADTKWVLKCYDKNVKFEYTDEVLINFSLGGVSSDIYWHMEECKRIIKEKFSFLKGDEVYVLHYVFYQWREGFKFPPCNLDVETEISKIVQKYSNRSALIDAIDLEYNMISNELKINNQVIESNLTNHQIERLKEYLYQYPSIYKILKKFYRLIKG